MTLMHFFRIARVTSIKASELIEVCDSNQSDPPSKNDELQYPQKILSTLHSEPEALFLEIEQKDYGKLKS